MRIPVLIIFLMFLNTFLSNGQDFVVTQHNDTVKCTISGITDSTLQIRVLYAGIERESFVALSDIVSYSFNGEVHNVNPKETVPFPENTTQPVPENNKKPANRAFVMIRGGSYFVIKNTISNSARNVFAIMAGMEGGYNLTKSFAIGLNYSFLLNNKRGRYSTVRRPPNYVEYGNQSMNFIGLLFILKSEPALKMPGFFLSLSPGAVFINVTYFLKTTYGVELAGGTEFMLSKHFLINLGFSYFYSPPFDEENLPVTNLSQLGGVIGLTYRFKK